VSLLLTDEEIGAIDIDCGMSEIDGTEPYYSYKYEYHLLKAQLKKVVDILYERSTACSAPNPWEIMSIVFTKEEWQAILEEVK